MLFKEERGTDSVVRDQLGRMFSEIIQAEDSTFNKHCNEYLRLNKIKVILSSFMKFSPY